MGEVKWTKEQLQAISKKDNNILVAAAAGSGKTAVLVERIIRKIINENIDIDKLLVVTFTNAAASEMRGKILDAIYKQLEKNPENDKLQKQLMLINKASICTIDAFCLDIIRNNFYVLDISPNFRIGDQTEMEILKQESLEELFEEKYEAENEDFQDLIKTYTSYKDDTPLKDLVLKIYTYIESNPFPEKWLEDSIEMYNLKENLDTDFSKTVWGKLILKELEEEVIDDIKILKEEKRKLDTYSELDKYSKIYNQDIVNLELFLANLNSWDKAYAIGNTIEFIRWTNSKVTIEEKDVARDIRKNVKEKFQSKVSKLLTADSKTTNQDIYEMYGILTKLKTLILDFDLKFSNKKREKNILDFSDIEHLALKILLNVDKNGNLVQTEVAKKYQEKFCEIAIDEYQDSNYVQEYILTSISRNNNIFMVGDVKQSIYKFRQAIPELFLSKYKTYNSVENEKENEGIKIQLFKNFRSRENILDITNMIFENIMGEELAGINYNKEEYLNLGACFETPINNLKTEIDIIDLKEPLEEKEDDEEINEEEEKKERVEDVELEARLVADKIKQLIDTKFQVFDQKNNIYRDITYKDIVILLRVTKELAPIYEKEILKLNIPVFSDSSSEYLDTMEIQTIMSLLKIIDNPMQDIPLVTVLRSPIGKFTDNDLVEIRLADKDDNFYTAMIKAKLSVSQNLKYKIDEFLNNLSMWRKENEYLALDELIWKIYENTGLYNYVGLMENGALRQANLKVLFQRAKQYESASFKGLFNFIKFIEKLQLSSNDLSAAKLIGEKENVVRIMSIHKSKGLEFPVVILAGTGKEFNLMDLRKDILLHQTLGLGVQYIDYDMQLKYDTLTKRAMKNELLKENLAEEMRILYVALTRAKEKIIITGIRKDYEKQLQKLEDLMLRYEKENGKINSIVIKKCKKYLDWIQLVHMYNTEKFEEIASINIYNKEDLIKKLKVEEEEVINVKEILENSEKNYKNIEKIAKILEYEYIYKDSVNIPTKASVTSIIKKNPTISQEDLNLEIVKEEELTNDDEILVLPKFLANHEEEKITYAKIGTLVHLCFKNLDISKEYMLQDVKDLISDLEEKQIITKKEADAINPFKIYNFTKSKIWKELKTAKLIEKEKPFYINVPASEIYENNLEEEILVQGIIDLYYINKENELILVDYKTDYIVEGEEKTLIERHSPQLKLYKDALEKSLNKKVYKTYIYSVALSKEIQVNF